MSILMTSRLLLRPFEEKDAAELYDYARDPRGGHPIPALKTAWRSFGRCFRPQMYLQ